MKNSIKGSFLKKINTFLQSLLKPALPVKSAASILFLSTIIPNSCLLLISFMYIIVFNSQFFEEVFKQRAAFLFKDTFYNLNLMVQPFIAQQIFK